MFILAHSFRGSVHIWLAQGTVTWQRSITDENSSWHDSKPDRDQGKREKYIPFPGNSWHGNETEGKWVG